jgi:hypothetical protein
VVSLGRQGANALQTFGVNTPIRDESMSQMVQHDRDQATEFVLEQTAERRQHSGDGGEMGS